MSYYDILGIGVQADAAEIHAAWRTRAKELHPDVNRSADAEDKFKAAKEAYECLSDPEKRRQYDLAQFAPKSHATGPSGDPFGGGFNEAIRNAQQSEAFRHAFDGPPLSEVLGGLVDHFAAGYVGRNPLLRAGYRRVRPDIHKSLRTVLNERAPQKKRRRSA